MKFFRDLQFNKSHAKKKSAFLKKGMYVLLPNMRTYVHVNAHRRAKKSFPQGGKGIKNFVKMLVSLFFGFYVSTSGKFNGEIVYFSTISNPDYRDCKIFSPENKKLMIFSANQRRYDLYIKNRLNNESLFPLPAVYEMNSDSLYIVEEYVTKDETDNTTVETVNTLMAFYLRYYKTCKDKNQYIKASEHPDKLCPGVDADRCPLLFLHHGDLSADNFICTGAEKKRLVFIDFDHEDYYPPFYDVFFLILNQAFSLSDYSLLEEFNAGVFDEYIRVYAYENHVLPIAILENCIRYIWEKRLQDYSQDKLQAFQKILMDTVDKGCVRMKRNDA